MKSTQTLQALLQRRIREGIFILSLALSFFMLLALATYHVADPGWSHLATHSLIKNSGGEAGAWFADLTLSLFGYLAYLIPLLFSYLGWLYLRDQFGLLSNKRGLIWMRLIGFTLVLLSGTAICHLNLASTNHSLPFQAGGILGYVVGSELQQVFNSKGTNLILFALLLMGITISTGFSWITLLENLGKNAMKLARTIFSKSSPFSTQETTASPVTKLTAGKIEPKFETKPIRNEGKKEEPKITMESKIVAKSPSKIEPKIEIKPSAKMVQAPLFQAPSVVESKVTRAQKSKAEKPEESLPTQEAIPSLSLLELPANDGYRLSDEELEEKSREVEVCLNDFGVEAKVVSVHPGPVVTRYELELAAGTKVSKITNLVKDLARSLSVISVRVVEVIPGKSVIGIELPNVKREVVSLREMLSSSAYQNSKSAISLALGKDIAGHPVVVDVAKMPHLLVAGTTGSGKSVCLNAILLSFLYKALPSQLRLILIDPKMLEFSIYDGIPHLLTPVVTDMKDAAKALRWCVIEMERRYRLMASLGVRNIANYNQKVKDAREKGTPLLDPIANDQQQPQELQEMPQIVIMADEFADMMMVVGKKIETLIARLAQKARAAGVHLILATQRPSVDVITGLIKANIPTRVAFQVSSKIDSRTILDQQGAEQLLGHGDMLYLPPGSGVPVRIHGAFVSDDEVHQVVTFLKQSGKPEYLEEVLDDNGGDELGSGGMSFSDGENSSSSSENDPLFDEAVKFVTQARRVSISSVQRRFKIGYNRAARIVDSMEAAGVVSAMETNGSREVIAPPPIE